MIYIATSTIRKSMSILPTIVRWKLSTSFMSPWMMHIYIYIYFITSLWSSQLRKLYSSFFFLLSHSFAPRPLCISLFTPRHCTPCYFFIFLFFHHPCGFNHFFIFFHINLKVTLYSRGGCRVNQLFYCWDSGGAVGFN